MVGEVESEVAGVEGGLLTWLGSSDKLWFGR